MANEITPPAISPRGLTRFRDAACAPPFRGGAIDNLEGAPMGKGHGNDGRPFDIETACYMKPIFAAYDNAVQNRTRLKLILKAGVKTIKSFALEVCCADHVCHRNGDAAIFFGTEAAAETTSSTRIVEYYRGIPAFRRKMDTFTSRFDETMGALKFPDKTLFIVSANLSNTQQKNVGFIGLQDGFVTGKSGMIEEMIARTTQYEREAIIFLESQGGEIGFDFERHYDDTNQGELHVRCPCCGTNHVFNWKAFDEAAMRRPDDFKPVPPLNIPSLDHVAWIEHNRPLMLHENRRVAGFQRGDDELIKFQNGDYNEQAILRETHFRCFHCDGIWRDDGQFGPTRVALDQSSNYVSARPTALAYHVGFNIPQWINRRLSWGNMMLEKLKRQKVYQVRGNFEPLKIWWQKFAGRTWDEAELNNRRIRRQDAYDVALAKHDAWRLMMICDNQLDLMTQWVMVLAVKKNGTVKQIWRGALHGLEEVRKKQMEYVTAEGKLILKNQFVFLDGRYKPDQICRHIVEHKYGNWATMDGERVWLAWNMMQGSAYEYFSHADEKDKSRKFITGDWTIRQYQMDGFHVEIWNYPFSATMTGQRFETARDWKCEPGEEPPIAFLDRMPDEPPDDNELSHHMQIYSNKLVASKSYAPRMAKMHYVPVPASRPDHWFHCWRMTMAVLEIWGVDGIINQAETENSKT